MGYIVILSFQALTGETVKSKMSIVLVLFLRSERQNCLYKIPTAQPLTIQLIDDSAYFYRNNLT